MSSYLVTSFLSLKSEVISGIVAHSNITPTPIFFLSIIIGWWSCVNTLTTFLSIEITILLTVLWRLEKLDRVTSLILRFLFSRLVAWWLFYTIYSQWYTELSILTALSFLTFPLLLSWYIFDPFLLPYRRYSLGDRFDYFTSRFSFFTGFGLLPLLLLLLWMFTSYYSYWCIYFIICAICSHQTTCDCPNYARYLPFTKKQFIVDPLDWVESIIDRYT